MAMTDKKRRFAHALISGASNHQAALDAGYSPKTAPQAGCRLAKDTDVLAHIERQKAVADAREAASEEGKPFNLSNLAASYADPKEFLAAVMNNSGEDLRLRVDAAKSMLPYVHAKVGEQGKKEQKASAAKSAGGGKFAQGAPPRLVVDNAK